MSSFDKLVPADDPAAPATALVGKVTGVFTPAHFPAPGAQAQALAESRKAKFVETPNIVLDQSHSWEMDLETLQKFWKWIHHRQPGLCEQFTYQNAQH